MHRQASPAFLCNDDGANASDDSNDQKDDNKNGNEDNDDDGCPTYFRRSREHIG
jgi:hypothetical protein